MLVFFPSVFLDLCVFRIYFRIKQAVLKLQQKKKKKNIAHDLRPASTPKDKFPGSLSSMLFYVSSL